MPFTQEAILEAIEVGLEDGYATAELALQRKRERRHQVMDALVAAMEVPKQLLRAFLHLGSSSSSYSDPFFTMFSACFHADFMHSA